MRTAKFTADVETIIELGASKGGKVNFFLITGHSSLGGGSLTVEVNVGGVWEDTGLTLVAGIVNAVNIDLGVGVNYRVKLTVSTSPDVWVTATGA